MSSQQLSNGSLDCSKNTHFVNKTVSILTHISTAKINLFKALVLTVIIYDDPVLLTTSAYLSNTHIEEATFLQ
jgi:hypothetical protein